VEVIERNTAVCLVSFKHLPEKRIEMNELSEAEYSGMERKEVSE
jgi:hypothetical protein